MYIVRIEEKKKEKKTKTKIKKNGGFLPSEPVELVFRFVFFALSLTLIIIIITNDMHLEEIDLFSLIKDLKMPSLSLYFAALFQFTFLLILKKKEERISSSMKTTLIFAFNLFLFYPL